MNMLAAIAYAPADGRLKLARASLANVPKANGVAVYEMKSLAEFERQYTKLAAELGRPAKSPSPGEVEFLASVEKRRRDYKGAIALADVLFLTAFVSILSPRRVLEIGTLTGFSAGVIAAALARRGRNGGAFVVDTIDIRADCGVDTKRPTGFEIAEFFPEVASSIRVHAPHDSTLVAELLGRNELELAFVDADHRHPFALLDLLRLAPYLQPGGWILLHDIQLGTLTSEALAAGRQTPFEPVYGAEWLFDKWPFRKISGGNIGAAQVPMNTAMLVPFAFRMLSIELELPPRQQGAARRAVYRAIAALC